MMSDRFPSFSGLSALHAAARCGSFSAAAQELNVSQPAISRRIAILESHLGCSLFDRGSRPLKLTPQGQELADTLATSFGQIEATTERLLRASSKSTVSISGPSGFMAFWLIPNLPALAEEFSDINVRIISKENNMNVRPGDIDIRFSTPTALAKDCFPLAQKILGDRVIVAASPFYVSQHGYPKTLEDFSFHALLSMEGSGSWYDWPSWFAQLGVPKVTPKREVEFSSYSILVGALLAGQGLGLAWSGLLDDFLESGALVQIGDHKMSSERGYFLSLRDAEKADQNVRNMATWIADTCAKKEA
jgi:LysR family glycine cleavage system transcriptional activator